MMSIETDDRPMPTGQYPDPGTVFPDQEWG